MKVYIIEHNVPYEGSEVVKVASSLELAIKLIDDEYTDDEQFKWNGQYIKEHVRWGIYYSIKDYEVVE